MHVAYIAYNIRCSCMNYTKRGVPAHIEKVLLGLTTWQNV